jgi:phosphomannomutase
MRNSKIKIAIDTLVKLGAHVVDIGMVSTPTFYFAVSHYGYESGFQITASHNQKSGMV